LSLDADEQVSADLREEILNLLHDSPNVDGFYLPRKNYLGGRWMRYAGLYPDYKLRLFRKGKGDFEGVVHERIKVKGEVGYLKGAILHHTYKALADYWDKINQYTSIEAEELFRQGAHLRWYMLLRPLALFFWLYIFRQGWRDGFLGLVNSLFLSWYQFLKYAKLWETRRC